LPDNYTRGNGLWKRILIGAFLIVLAAAGATSVAAFHEVHRVVEAFHVGPQLKLGDELATADPGKPQTIMLIGSDKRAKTARDYQGGSARSDTIILIRLDPSKKATALLSIPRDLKVDIPGYGINKINAAYTFGGPRLVLATVRHLTGLRINHVIDTDFIGFVNAIDQLGCVYLDVDERYYNSGLGFDNYAAINLQPGYQRLCGRNALSFVRYRHTDSDIVRAARQQMLLSQLKQQVSLGKLISEQGKLLDIFGHATQSDIRSTAAVLRLLKLALASAGHPVQEVQVSGLGVDLAATGPDGAAYVTITPEKMHKLARQFIGVEPIKSASSSSSSSKSSSSHRRHHHRPTAASLGLVDASQAGKSAALQLVTAGAHIPIYYPRAITSPDQFVGPAGSGARAYWLRTAGGHRYAAYRIVVKRRDPGQYWGVQGVAWRNPPILKHPSETRHYHGRTFYIYFEGDATRLVAWKTPRAVYWVSNTLSAQLSEDQMIAIAESTATLS
jgi:LCP family protein required for cell wall assembly